MKLTKKQNIKISIIITFITMIISMVIHIFYTPFMLNKVGDDQYGLYGFASSALTWLSVAVNAILSAYNKIVSEEVAKDPEKGESNINSVYSLIVVIWSGLISIFAGVFLILMATGVINLDAYDAQDRQTILILFGVVSIQMIITVLTNVASLNITYNNHHVWIKASTMITTILTPLITIPFLVNGFGVITVVIIQVSLLSISNILNIFYDRFYLKKKYSFFPKKELLKYIKPIFLFCSVILVNEIAYQLDNSIDNLALGSKGYSVDITLYGLALSIVTIAQTCSNMIYAPFIPTIFDNEANGRQEENKKLFDVITFSQMTLWLLITGGFISCGREFTLLWVGKDREIVYFICSSLFIIRSVSNCQGPSRDMMRARNKHLHRAILAVAVTVINTGLTILFINIFPREHAVWGCVLGTAISSVLGWWIACNIISKICIGVDIKRFVLSFFGVMLCAGAASAIPVLINRLVLSNYISNNIALFAIGGFTFVVIFAGLMFLLFKKRLKECYLLFKSK